MIKKRKKMQKPINEIKSNQIKSNIVIINLMNIIIRSSSAHFHDTKIATYHLIRQSDELKSSFSYYSSPNLFARYLNNE